MTSSTVLAALGVLTLVGRPAAERKIADLQADIEPNRQLSTSLAFDAEPRATDAMLRA